MLPPGPLPPGAPCRQVASTSRGGGIPVPRAWPALPERMMAPKGITQELVPSLSLSCSGLDVSMSPCSRPLLGRCSRSERPFLCCTAGADNGAGVSEDGLWMLVESFSSRVVELGLDRSCVSSRSCTAEALQGYGTARQTKLLEGWEGCGCAKPDGSHVWSSGCPTSLYRHP